MKISPIILLILLKICVLSSSAQTVILTAPPNGNNQKSSVTQWIGITSVTITYHGPDVHDPNGEDRKGHIWGELVPYGLNDIDGYGTSLASPWRAGSNEITCVTFSNDVTINRKEIKAGTYGLFLLLDKDKPWTWIFSKNSTSWGSYYYTSDEDVLRIETTPEDCAYTEWLTYGFDNRQAASAIAYLQWENKRVPFKIEVPTATQLYVNQMRAELTSYAGFNYVNWLKSAQFCLNNKINLEEALKWVDISMNSDRFNGVKSFSALKTKSDILNALDREADADMVMHEALAMNPSVQEIHQYGRSLLDAGKKEKALEIFKMNREKHKNDKFTTYVGLARGYAATGNKKEAIKNWEIALKNIPEEQKANTGSFQEEIKKLKT